MVQQEAVVVRNATKGYERKTLILKGLDMTVSKGSIYGLLGASGCGKTTLLTCIVGVRNLNKGEIWVLGGTPGSKNSGIPGPRVGYMPQEISLVGEFTVRDAFYYFGMINGLQNEEIETRKEFLSKLLQLPPDDRFVKNMSGGQQRRVSFAAALLHNPELLILDEPTVGLDPILRENIWAHLIKLTKEDNVTIVITTHYIEEAKDADKIGLMRNGQLLAEASPQQLLQQCQCSSLEEAFLTLSAQQNNMATETFTVQTSKPEDTESNILNQNNYDQIEDKTSERKTNPERKVARLKKFKALMMKNSMQFFRYYTGLAFAVIFPIVQISTFYIGVAKDIKTLEIGVINDDAGNCDYNNNFGNIWYDEEMLTCHFGNLSCKFLHDLGNSIATQDYYNNISEATVDVKDGKLVGMIHFHQNFSKALERRLEAFAFTEESDLIATEIQIFLDMADSQVGNYMKKKLFDRFIAIYEDVMKDCRLSTKLANVPIRFEDPIYGTSDPAYADFMAPAYIITLAFVLATIVSTSLIVTDRLEGVWYRSLVQGVQTWEILLSHILCQTIIVIIHTAMILGLSFLAWGLECKGSIFPVILITFLSGMCGLMYGAYPI
ncbi:ABC transporter G family member 23-like isoform X2 [Ooceraea biroi]|uniref:ABC transporter G family member 23-like isoform X2 n=1 Tax=Ooceraea biroi TaxID=2015173 RepID=UPI000F090650|nr:ABC transporter G family member 23-like isoform X2 [Ooceraea biroi]